MPPEARWIPDLYDEAVRGILAVYENRGYLEAAIEGPLVRRDGERIAITPCAIDVVQDRDAACREAAATEVAKCVNVLR